MKNNIITKYYDELWKNREDKEINIEKLMFELYIESTFLMITTLVLFYIHNLTIFYIFISISLIILCDCVFKIIKYEIKKYLDNNG